MRTIAIPQLYCGASGKKGAYNRQEVGLARRLPPWAAGLLYCTRTRMPPPKL